jgi:hypothetical protein
MSKFKVGDLVEVDSVLPDDLHTVPFCGTVEFIAHDTDGTEYARVEDQEGNSFDIDTDRLRLVE